LSQRAGPEGRENKDDDCGFRESRASGSGKVVSDLIRPFRPGGKGIGGKLKKTSKSRVVSTTQGKRGPVKK